VNHLVLGIGVAAIFLAIFLALAAFVTFVPERQRSSESLALLKAYGSDAVTGGPDEVQAGPDGLLGSAFEQLAAVGRRISPAGHIEKLRLRLGEAGSPEGWTVDRVLAFKVLAAAVATLLGLAVAALLHSGPVRLVSLTGLAGLAGFFVPNMVLYQTAHNRAERIQLDLPDALDLLTITVEAGLAFDAALAQVARNTTGPLAEEFFRVLQEMQIGLGRQNALKALAERADVPELHQFVSAIAQADAFGIPVGNVLRVQAQDMRLKRSQRAEEKAQKIPVKILMPLIFCILPVLFIVVIGPAGVGIYHAFGK
jgi:tight adherence protein C